jgi:hypothetical protein
LAEERSGVEVAGLAPPGPWLDNLAPALCTPGNPKGSGEKSPEPFT